MPLHGTDCPHRKDAIVTTTTSPPQKPLGRKAYGSIGHLPGSRMDTNHQKHGTGKVVGKDFGVHPGQATIFCERARDRHDTIVVQEKLDGSNVAVAKIDGVIIALGRAGWPARTSPYPQHHRFDEWVNIYYSDFDAILREGEWVSGEWMAQAHGTIYDLDARDPFVVFDMWSRGARRRTYLDMIARVGKRFTTAPLLSYGPPLSVEDALWMLGPRGRYGATESVEGAVWRVERNGRVETLAKYVRPEKVDGKYLPDISGRDPIWNWELEPEEFDP